MLCGGVALTCFASLTIASMTAPASAATPVYRGACDGASEAAGAFADAGLAADCLKLYGVALGKADGSFGEDDGLVRSQVASLLTRMIAVAAVSLSQQRSFPDVNPTTVPSAQVRDDLQHLGGLGIVT